MAEHLISGARDDQHGVSWRGSNTFRPKGIPGMCVFTEIFLMLPGIRIKIIQKQHGCPLLQTLVNI